MAVAQIVSKSCRYDATAATPNASTYLDTDGQWPKLSGTTVDGLILVRPDGHVLWRCKNLAALAPPESGSQQQHAQTVLQSAKDHVLHALKVCLAST